MDFKTKLVEKLKETALSVSGLESLTIVGSHGDPNKKLEKTNDFDLLFIVKELNAESYLSIKGKMDTLAKNISNKDVKVWTEYRVGPVKAAYEGVEKMGLMLHVLLFDLKSFSEYQKISPFIALDWLKFEPLYGKKLSNMYKFGFPTKEDLLHTQRASFEYYEKMLNDKVYILLDIEVEGNNLKYNRHSYPYPEAQWCELYADILKKVILNTLIVYRKVNKTWSEDELVEDFCNIFTDLNSDKDNMKEIIGLKKRLRNGEKIDDVSRFENNLRVLLSKIKGEITK